MKVMMQVYDGDIKELLDVLDQKAREIDSEKYGLPLQSNLAMFVYGWLSYKTKMHLLRNPENDRS